MKHSITREGVGFRLRPVSLDDAAFIVELRTDPERAKHLHATSPKIEDQIAWTNKYFERDGDWYFVVEHIASGRKEGAIAIYNYDAAERTAEWGRWILRNGSLAASESAALIYDIGFDELDLASMYTNTEEVNEPVVSFHTSFGSSMVGPVTGPEGEKWTRQEMSAEQWREQRRQLKRQIDAAAAMSNR